MLHYAKSDVAEQNMLLGRRENKKMALVVGSVLWFCLIGGCGDFRYPT